MTITRIAFVSRVRQDKLDDYRERHAAVWPEMLEALRDSGWSDYHLYLSSDGLLVGHFLGESYEACQAAMAATAVNARWQAQMSEFIVNPGNPDEGFEILPEVFHLEAQLEQAGLPTAAAPSAETP